MCPERIVLHDYSEIKTEEYYSVCRDVQDSINKNPIGIINLDSQNREIKKLFSFDGEKPYVKKYVGIVEHKGKTILIQSRFDKGNERNLFLSYVLKHSDYSPLLYGSVPAASGYMHQMLVMAFLRLLKEAFDVGAYRQYITTRKNDNKIKGSLDIAGHIKANYDNSPKIAYLHREYSIDNSLNRLILCAWHILTDELRKIGSSPRLNENRTLMIPIQQLQAQLDYDVTSVTMLQDLLNKTERPVTHPYYSRYENLRILSRQIAARHCVSNFKLGSRFATGIIMPMDKVWESFVEKCLFNGIGADSQRTIDVLLTDNCSQGKRQFRPDFMLDEAVVDAKYREPWAKTYDSVSRWDENVRMDVFQILSYMLVCKKKNGGLVFPYGGNDGSFKKFVLEKSLSDHCLWLMPFNVPQGEFCDDEYNEHMEKNCEAFKANLEKLRCN